MNYIYPPLLMVIVLTMIAVVLCDRIKKLQRQYLVGIIFGSIGFAANFLNYYLTDLDMFLGIRDAPTQVAALYFGPQAAIISALIAASGRIFNGVFITGNGSSSMYQFAAGSVVVTLFACVLRKWVFENRRPGVLTTALSLAHGEIVMYCFLLLISRNRFVMEEGFATFFPEALYKFLCGLGAAICSRDCHFLPEKKQRINSALFGGYFVLLCTVFLLCFIAITRRLSNEMNIAIQELAGEPGNKIAKVLISLSDEIKQNGCSAQTSSDTLKQWADKYSLGEISIISSEPRLIASSLLKDYQESGSFDKLYNLRFAQYTCGKFLGGIEISFSNLMTPDWKYRIYAIEPLNDKGTFLVLGMNYLHYIQHIEDYGLPDIKDWYISKSGFYLITNIKTGLVEAVHNDHIDFLFRKFRECVRTIRESNEMETIRIEGASYLSKHFDLYGYSYFAIMPFANIYRPLIQGTLLLGAIWAFLIVLFGISLKQRLRTRELLERQREETTKRHIQDLETAKTIQTSALPMQFPPSIWDLTINLFATMQPANEVGGDFYDFYYLSENRIVFLVADVSGKGIPAAMFMMKAKSIIKSSVQNGIDLGESMTEVNKLLCQDNSAEMFVTCWIGILNTGDGTIEYVNAAHNAPYIRHSNCKLEKLDKISGFFLAGLEETEYKTSVCNLNVGDTIFLYTDGVTEANDKAKTLFDDSRLEKVLSSWKPELNDDKGIPKSLCYAVNDAVKSFSEGAPQFDDMTMLALHYRGKPQNRFCTIQAEKEYMPKMTAFVEEQLELVKCDEENKNSILIVLDEIATNVVSYSKSPELSLKLTYAANPATIILTFSDSGLPYNPLNAPAPDFSLDEDDRPIGGLGIFITKQMMDEVAYTRKNGCNILTLLKYINNTTTKDK